MFLVITNLFKYSMFPYHLLKPGYIINTREGKK